MSLRIEDGKGSGKEAGVDDRNRLMASVVTSNRAAIVAKEDELCFNVAFTDASAAAGNYVAYIQNTSTTRELVIDKIRVSAANAATWLLHAVTGTGSGTAETPINTNRSSGKSAEATCLADNITGLTSAGEMQVIRTPANSAAALNVDDTIRLGPDDAIAVEYDAGTTGAAGCTMRFYYEDI